MAPKGKPKAAADVKPDTKANQPEQKPASEQKDTTPVADASDVGTGAGAGVAAAASAPNPDEMFVRVVGPRKGRWRTGRQFGREPVFIPLDELKDREAEAIRDDPVLTFSVVSATEMQAELAAD